MKEFQELTKDIDPEKKDALEKILNRFYDLKKGNFKKTCNPSLRKL
jgi:hypothetical protein